MALAALSGGPYFPRGLCNRGQNNSQAANTFSTCSSLLFPCSHSFPALHSVMYWSLNLPKLSSLTFPCRKSVSDLKWIAVMGTILRHRHIKGLHTPGAFSFSHLNIVFLSCCLCYGHSWQKSDIIIGKRSIFQRYQTRNRPIEMV